MRQGNGHGHQFRRIITGISKHHSLIAGANRQIRILRPILGLHGYIHSHGNIRRLLIQRSQHRTCVTVKPKLRPVVSDLADRLSRNLGNIHIALGRDLSHHQHQSRSDRCLAGNPRLRILRENGVQNPI